MRIEATPGQNIYDFAFDLVVAARRESKTVIGVHNSLEVKVYPTMDYRDVIRRFDNADAKRCRAERVAAAKAKRAYPNLCKQIKKLITEYEMKLENAERYGHGDELIIEDMIKDLKGLVG